MGAVLLVAVGAVDDVDDVVVVEVPVVEVVDEVEVDVDVVEVVVGEAGGGLMRLFTDVPVSDPPKMADNGLPDISSIAVISSSASTKTITAATAIVCHENRRPAAAERGPAGGSGRVEACRRSVAGASVTAEISRRSVCPTGAAVDAISTVSAPASSVGDVWPISRVGADDVEPRVSPDAPVPPSRRSSNAVSGALTTTCLTASCPRSIDWATKAVPMVAAADPIATPTMVPLTPKVDAMTAAITAPAVEARIWRNENFTQGCLVARQGSDRAGDELAGP